MDSFISESRVGNTHRGGFGAGNYKRKTKSAGAQSRKKDKNVSVWAVQF